VKEAALPIVHHAAHKEEPALFAFALGCAPGASAQKLAAFAFTRFQRIDPNNSPDYEKTVVLA
jgi:hypothetical protein